MSNQLVCQTGVPEIFNAVQKYTGGRVWRVCVTILSLTLINSQKLFYYQSTLFMHLSHISKHFNFSFKNFSVHHMCKKKQYT